ncbi:hypothetical protein HMPREF9554_00007 [Treponema phagedenis F0421]|nr:hypothetical protein HMPREF9554_00007 [Treponema phagedenis F0421]
MSFFTIYIIPHFQKMHKEKIAKDRAYARTRGCRPLAPGLQLLLRRGFWLMLRRDSVPCTPPLIPRFL